MINIILYTNKLSESSTGTGLLYTFRHADFFSEYYTLYKQSITRILIHRYMAMMMKMVILKIVMMDA